MGTEFFNPPIVAVAIVILAQAVALGLAVIVAVF